MEWVSYIQQVGVVLYQLQVDVCDVELVVLMMFKGIDVFGLCECMVQINDIFIWLFKLVMLIQDNFDQLVCIGCIEFMLEWCMELVKQLVCFLLIFDQCQLVQDMIICYLICNLVEDLQKYEENLFVQWIVNFVK